jgi:hypothetical protein
MRLTSRTLVALLLAAGGVACSDTKTINAPIPPGMHAGKVALNPVFSPSARTIAASLGDFGITFGQVRVTIRKHPDSTVAVLDTVVAFTPSSNSLTLNLTLPVDSVGEVFNALVQYLAESGPVYAGSILVTSYAPDQEPPEQAALVLNFVGPGAKLKTLTMSPKPVTLVGSQSVPITFAATDSSGASIAVPPLVFASSDETIAKVVTVEGTRSVQSFGKRGQARIIATTPTGISDTLIATVTLPATSLVLVSGGGQSGIVGALLTNPAVVQVNDKDGLGVAGVTVTFTAPAGGSVGTPTATTDANGRASTTMTLGSAVGAQTFVATVSGLTPVPIVATAGSAIPRLTTPDTGIVVLNTFAQTPTHYPVVVVKDGLGNPVVGQLVTFEVGGIDRESSSPCHINMVSATTNAKGEIAFDPNTFLFASGADFPYSCLLFATAIGSNNQPLLGSPLLVPVVVAPSTGTTWTGRSGDRLWTTKENWTNGVPGLTGTVTSAFMPLATTVGATILNGSPSLTGPQLGADASVGTIDLEDGAVLDLNGHTLTIGGSVNGRSVGTIMNGTVTTAPGTQGGSLSGNLPAFLCSSSGAYTFDTFATFESLTNSGCLLSVGFSTVVVQKDFTQTGSGRLQMDQSESFLEVVGTTTFNGGDQLRLLTDGVMLLQGNLVQKGTTGSFTTGGSHNVFMSNAGQPQTISFEDPAHSSIRQLNLSLLANAPFTIQSALVVQDTLVVSATPGSTLNLMNGLQSGVIEVFGQGLITNVSGTVTTGGLVFDGGTTITLAGSGGLNIAGSGQVLTLNNDTHLTINVTGTLTVNPNATCVAGSNVKIDGTTQNLDLLRRICGLLVF